MYICIWYLTGALLSETQILSIQPFELVQVIISTGEDSTTQRTSITYGYTTILNHQSHPISYPTAQSADSGSDVLVKYSEKIHKPLRDTLWPDRPFVNKDTALASGLSSVSSSSSGSKNSGVNFKHLRHGIASPSTTSSTSYNSESPVVPLIMWSDNIHSSDTITYYTNTTKPRRISDTAVEQYRILNIPSPPHLTTTSTTLDSSGKGHNYNTCYKRLIGSKDGKIDYNNITGDTRQCIYPYNNAYFCGYTLCNTHTPSTADAYNPPTANTTTTTTTNASKGSKDASYTAHSEGDYNTIYETDDATALLGQPYPLSGEGDSDEESVSIMLPLSMTQASSDAKYIHIFETLLSHIQQQYYTMIRLSPIGSVNEYT